MGHSLVIFYGIMSKMMDLWYNIKVCKAIKNEVLGANNS